MTVSLIGIAVCAVIWGVGWLMGSPTVVGLIVSVAFGTTSAMTLGALGGSSPLIYFIFAALLICGCCLNRDLAASLKRVFKEEWVVGVVIGLILYSMAGAILLPRLFAGETSAFVAARGIGVVEVALSPSSGNITQTGYFILGALTFIALLATLRRSDGLSSIRKGFFAWALVNAVGGVIDLTAKIAGAGDIMMPIRTATFSYLTETEQAGFWRINGTYSEASSFGGAALASMAYTYMSWRHAGSRTALLVSLTLLVLLVLSTSTTAYVGLGVMLVPLLASLIHSLVRGALGSDGILIILVIAIVSALVIFVALADHAALEPFQKLFQTTLLDKSQSESGRERSHWNQRSLESLFDTWGFGIGFGSSRASNWFVAVLSQLGLVGFLMQLALLLPFFKRVARPPRSSPSFEAFVLHEGLRACALATMVAGAVAGGSADPGLLFFVALAGLLACQATLAQARRPAPLQSGAP